MNELLIGPIGTNLNFNQNTTIFSHESTFQNVIRKMSPILFRPQYVCESFQAPVVLEANTGQTPAEDGQSDEEEGEGHSDEESESSDEEDEKKEPVIRTKDESPESKKVSRLHQRTLLLTSFSTCNQNYVEFG